MRIAAFIQSRMSSKRFPGKMLAPFRGEPVLDHVVAAVRAGVAADPVLLTSTLRSDDPLAVYAVSRGVRVFRGALDDVLGRFRGALEACAPDADWVLRICGDSPVMSPRIMQRVIEQIGNNSGADLITVTQKRTFPSGQSPELMRASTLRRLDDERDLTADDREHVTRAIHRRPGDFTIVNIESKDLRLGPLNHSIDTIEDLMRLEGVDTEAEIASGL
jgi:spore coat polysaccharide biosynthesis protein SpsF